MTNFLMLIGAIFFFVLAAYSLRVTPEDVAACVEQTGWSEERCQMELSR